MKETITLQDVNAALSLVQKYLFRTPLVYSPELSEETGNHVYFKLESMQRTHAFKARGALNKILSLNREERKKGVIAASSGNHALGVAYSSELLDIDATVIMPTRTPTTKIELAKRYGARVILYGETYDEAVSRAHTLAVEYEKVFIPSVDDSKIIAGHGTIVLEVLDQLPDMDIFLAPVGGGGLVTGLGLTLANVGHSARVIGIEADGAQSMIESVRAGERKKLPHIKTIADGIAVQEPGKLGFEFVNHYGIEIYTVRDDQILNAIKRVLREVRVVIEPAAAVGPAALIFNNSLHNLGKRICCVITGGNISDNLLQQLIQEESLPAIP